LILIVEDGGACENHKVIEQLQTAELEPAAQHALPLPTETGLQWAPVAFAATVFLSAFLLFQVQLVIGKYILPLFGGAPSVWNTCMLFFQVLLLVGYAYSHILASRFSLRTQALIHGVFLISALVLFALVWMKWTTPLTPGPDWKPQAGDDPVWKILQLLAVTVAIPFFLLSTTGPLLQSWLSRTRAGNSPYRLYALSNAGSLLGLLSYPFLLEWVFTLRHQAQLWSSGYLVFITVCAGIAWRTRDKAGLAGKPSPGATQDSTSVESTAPQPPKYLLLVAFSACSSTILLATTNLLSQDLTVIPLLWVVPLSLYLLSYIFTFDSNRWYQRRVFWPLYFLLLGLILNPKSLGYHGKTAVQIIVSCAALFVVCMVCHGELARSKPASRQLTAFFFMIALGGALGGIFVVLVAPSIFSGFWEFQIALLSCGFLIFFAFVLEDRSGGAEQASWTAAVVLLGAFLVPHVMSMFPAIGALSFLSNEYYMGAMAALILLTARLLGKNRKKAAPTISDSNFSWQPITTLALLGLFAVLAYSYAAVGLQHILFYKRNFFGVKYVIETPDLIEFVCGSTVHGTQFKDAGRRNIPTVYYRPNSGIGLLLRNYPRGASGTDSLRVGTIGLGVGTLASYGRSGDVFRFYEIDPAIPALSDLPTPYFQFIKDSPASIQLVMGDGRLSLEREAARGNLQKFDVLVADAFSSDAVPVHLLTREAVGIYLRHLREGRGVLAFNISSRFLELAPVIGGLAEAYQLSAVQVRDQYSLWILLSNNPELFRIPNLERRATPIVLKRHTNLWTDDYSNLLAVLGRQQFQPR
jgi:hypothetical protein